MDSILTVTTTASFWVELLIGMAMALGGIVYLSTGNLRTSKKQAPVSKTSQREIGS